jgi:hypothetical protein
MLRNCLGFKEVVMVEATRNLPYDEAMKRSVSPSSQTSAIAPMSFLDLRQEPAPVTLYPGQTIEAAWAATGMYLKKALSRYGTESSNSNS